MKNKLILIFFVGGVIFSSCKKDKDAIPPKISISSPQENNSFKVFDTIFASANITDETQLKSANVQLLLENLTPALSISGKTISGKNYLLKDDYVISDPQLISGFYYLKISASDGVNETKEYVKIYVTASPTKRKGIAIVSAPASYSVAVSILDSNNSIQPFIYLGNCDFSSSCASSKYQYINILGKTTMGLNSYRITDKVIQWSVAAGTVEYFEHLDFYNEISYVCGKSGTNGTIRGYDQSGSVQFSASTNSGYFPEKSFFHNSYLLVQEKEVSSANRRLSLYYSSGTLKQSVAISMNIVAFAKMDDNNIFLFGNDNNDKGQIMIYKISDSGTLPPYPLSGTISDVAQADAYTYLVALPDAVYKYVYSPVNFVAHIHTAGVQKIKYDDVNNLVVTASGNTLGFYDYNSGQPVSSYTHSDSIADFHLLFNK